MGFGHYTAVCKNPEDNKWYEYNDSFVKDIRNPSSSFSGSEPYVLFYQLSN